MSRDGRRDASTAGEAMSAQSIKEFDRWRQANNLDIHWTGRNSVKLTAIRGKKVWSAEASNVEDAVEILKLQVENNMMIGVGGAR